MDAAINLNQKQGPQDEILPIILIVDDHHVTADIERNYLGSVGFQVQCATSPASVLDMVKAHEFDLMIIDMSFAKEQGLKVMKEAKKVSKNQKMKVIVTSVVGLPNVRKQAGDAGADDFLVKPAPRPKFLKEIKKLTSQKTRDAERIKQSIELAYTFNGMQRSAKSLDMSGDGVHLEAHKEGEDRPPIGSQIVLSFTLGRGEKPMQIPGTVVRHTQEGFGIKFGDISKMTKRQLDKYLLKFSMEHRASQFYL